MRAIQYAIGFCSVVFFALAISLWWVGLASAQTTQEKASCKPDAYRLCVACIPGAIITLGGNRQCFYDCFARHRNELSPTCDRVLRRHGY